MKITSFFSREAKWRLKLTQFRWKLIHELLLYKLTLNFIIIIIIIITTGSLTWWIECSPMVRETGVQSQVESLQRLKKWHLIPPCLTLSNIRYVSKIKWRNPGKGVAPSPTPRCSSYWKGSLRVTLDYGRQLYFFYLFIFTNPSAQAGYDTWSIFKRSLTGLNSEFSFS